MPFVEAFRQFQFKVKKENFANVHVSLIPQVTGIIGIYDLKYNLLFHLVFLKYLLKIYL